MTKAKPGLSEIQRTLDELEADGLVRRTGELRNGEPVYALTERGQRWGCDDAAERREPKH